MLSDSEKIIIDIEWIESEFFEIEVIDLDLEKLKSGKEQLN